MAIYMVNGADQRICHKGHRMTKDNIYTEYRKEYCKKLMKYLRTCRV